MASKKKFYVVWNGKKPGVFTTWEECNSSISGYPNAKYKSFPTLESAEKAFREGSDEYWGTGKFISGLSDEQLASIGQPITNSICVDAAWNAETKEMEYRGVWHHDRSIAFQQGPFAGATNNIGEFLAIVHALALMAKKSLDWPVYSDSQTAICWVRERSVNSRSMRNGETSQEINSLVARAVHWLVHNDFPNEVLKWQTEAWGEVPADYGRK
jgi:ribonuclease HI